MPCIVAAYTSAPTPDTWDEALEAAFYDGIFAIPGVDGLEIPFTGALHAHDEGWLLRRLPEGWCHVVTCLPGTMMRLGERPGFGLASTDPAGRAAALEFVRSARAAMARLNDAAGAACVMAVEVHSAPSRRNSAAALADSLSELAALDWEGAALVIEHCDAWTSAHPPEKGFLPLDEELAAITTAARAGETRLGVSINWARSVIETRHAGTAAAHIAQAAERLVGVMFSGCSAEADQPYGAWQDNHMPLGPHCLLTAAAVGESLAAGRPEFVGVKLGARPVELGLEQRIRINRELIEIINAGPASLAATASTPDPA